MHTLLFIVKILSFQTTNQIVLDSTRPGSIYVYLIPTGVIFNLCLDIYINKVYYSSSFIYIIYNCEVYIYIYMSECVCVHNKQQDAHAYKYIYMNKKKYDINLC